MSLTVGLSWVPSNIEKVPPIEIRECHQHSTYYPLLTFRPVESFRNLRFPQALPLWISLLCFKTQGFSSRPGSSGRRCHLKGGKENSAKPCPQPGFPWTQLQKYLLPFPYPQPFGKTKVGLVLQPWQWTMMDLADPFGNHSFRFHLRVVNCNVSYLFLWHKKHGCISNFLKKATPQALFDLFLRFFFFLNFWKPSEVVRVNFGGSLVQSSLKCSQKEKLEALEKISSWTLWHHGNVAARLLVTLQVSVTGWLCDISDITWQYSTDLASPEMTTHQTVSPFTKWSLSHIFPLSHTSCLSRNLLAVKLNHESFSMACDRTVSFTESLGCSWKFWGANLWPQIWDHVWYANHPVLRGQ